MATQSAQKKNTHDTHESSPSTEVCLKRKQAKQNIIKVTDNSAPGAALQVDKHRQREHVRRNPTANKGQRQTPYTDKTTRAARTKTSHRSKQPRQTRAKAEKRSIVQEWATQAKTRTRETVPESSAWNSCGSHSMAGRPFTRIWMRLAPAPSNPRRFEPPSRGAFRCRQIFSHWSREEHLVPPMRWPCPDPRMSATSETTRYKAYPR